MPLLSLSQQTGLNGGHNTINAGVDLFSGSTAISNPFLPLTGSVTTGVNFGSLYSGNYFQSYLSPAIGFPVNKKLYLSTGITYSNTQFNNLPAIGSDGNFQRVSGNLNTLTLSVSGLYQVNERLNITGSAYKTINPAFNARLDPQNIQSEAKGMSVGFNYKLSDKAYIGAEIRMQQGNTPFYHPYNSGYNNIFNNGNYIPGFAPF